MFIVRLILVGTLFMANGLSAFVTDEHLIADYRYRECNTNSGNSSSLFSYLRSNNESDSLSKYKVETCDNSIEKEYPSYHYGIRVCSDGTTSFEQPESEGIFGSEGKCGQTATSNVFHMYCEMIASPSYCDAHLDDAGPGVSPSTLDKGIDKLFNEEYKRCPRGFWDETNYKYHSDFILGIEYKINSVPQNGHMVIRKLPSGKKRKKAPVIVLIKTPGSKKGLHWVTVVDVERSGGSCQMVLNTWGEQYKVPCKKMAQWSSNVEKSFGPILSKYTVIDFHVY